MTNEVLLSIYMLGWQDESCGVTKQSLKYKNKLLQKAYDLGVSHFVVGDDVSSTDKLSDEEILKLIKEL